MLGRCNVSCSRNYTADETCRPECSLLCDVQPSAFVPSLVFSLSCIGFVAWSYRRNFRLRRHPSQLILLRCLCDLVFCLTFTPIMLIRDPTCISLPTYGHMCVLVRPISTRAFQPCTTHAGGTSVHRSMHRSMNIHTSIHMPMHMSTHIHTSWFSVLLSAMSQTSLLGSELLFLCIALDLTYSLVNPFCNYKVSSPRPNHRLIPSP